MKRFITLLFFSLVAIATAAEPNTVTVTGVGTVYQAPDSAWLNVGVSTEQAEINDAMAEIDNVIAAITDAAMDFGIPESGIQTVYFNVWESQTYDTDEPQTMFYANHSLNIMISDIDMLPRIVEASIHAGANSINGIDFVISNSMDSFSEARAAAMDDARHTANELAELSGYTLGRVISVREGNFNTTSGYDPMFARGDGYGIQPGQESVRVVLEVVFELQEQ